MSYLSAMKVAIFVFPFIAFLITLPYLLIQYHKYGSVPLLRSFIVYSFVLYLLILYFLVIYPLPTMDEVLSLKTPTMQLIPMHFVVDFLKETSLVLNDPATYLKALSEPSFYTVFFNILMFLPLGVYLRYYFKCSFKKTLLISFLFTLFFELTQLSGLYGIYPRPYRLFDVDDLIMNTFGGLVGYAVTPLFTFLLPTKQNLDNRSYQKGKLVSFPRRCLAFFLDFPFIILLSILFSMFISSPLLCCLIAFVTYFTLLPVLWKGKTIGKNLVKIKVTCLSKPFLSYLLRSLLLYGGLFLPSIIIMLLPFSDSLVLLLLVFMAPIYYIFYFLRFLSSLLKKRPWYYERLSKTKLESTILIEEKLEIEASLKEDSVVISDEEGE